MIRTNPVTLLQGHRKGIDHLEEEDLKDAICYIGQGSWSGVSYQLRAFACVGLIASQCCAKWPESITSMGVSRKPRWEWPASSIWPELSHSGMLAFNLLYHLQVIIQLSEDAEFVGRICCQNYFGETATKS